MKKIYLFTLVLVILIQLAVPFSMIQGHETVLREGELYRFKTQPIDPADPFQGRFVWLGIEKDYVEVAEDAVDELTVGALYAEISVDEEGYAYFSNATHEKPTTDSYLRTRTHGRYFFTPPETNLSHVTLKIPFDRYYMEESKAPRAEVLARDASAAGDCWVEVRIFKGKAVIEDVLVEGVPMGILAAEKDE